MGDLAKTIFSLLLGWLPTVAYTIWNGINNHDGNSFFSWIGHHLILVFVIICLIGSTADLLVYCFRWKPLTVLKSFFRRHRDKTDPGQPDETEFFEEKQKKTDTDSEEGPVYPGISVKISEYADDHDHFSSFNQANPYRNGIPNGIGQTRTGRYAKYTETAEDADPERPYRRPVTEPPVPERYLSDEPESTMQNIDRVMGPRRRRIRMQQLFGNDDEDQPHYEPPKPVIDRSEAYHSPVYPRNWKGNGDEG